MAVLFIPAVRVLCVKRIFLVFRRFGSQVVYIVENRTDLSKMTEVLYFVVADFILATNLLNYSSNRQLVEEIMSDLRRINKWGTHWQSLDFKLIDFSAVFL